MSPLTQQARLTRTPRHHRPPAIRARIPAAIRLVTGSRTILEGNGLRASFRWPLRHCARRPTRRHAAGPSALRLPSCDSLSLQCRRSRSLRATPYPPENPSDRSACRPPLSSGGRFHIHQGADMHSRNSVFAFLLVFILVFLSVPARAQEPHAHPAPAEPADTARVREARPQDTTQPAMPGMVEEPLGIPHAREASGTAWLPDETPMYAFHRTRGRWELMLHGSVAVQYVDEGGDRGDEQFGSTNWIMGMAH